MSGSVAVLESRDLGEKVARDLPVCSTCNLAIRIPADAWPDRWGGYLCSACRDILIVVAASVPICLPRR